MKPDLKDVEWLLEELCSRCGFSTAIQNPERFVTLVEHGPDVFADAVLRAEGLDPMLDKGLRRGIREFVAARFEVWSSRRQSGRRSSDGG